MSQHSQDLREPLLLLLNLLGSAEWNQDLRGLCVCSTNVKSSLVNDDGQTEVKSTYQLAN